MLTCYPSLLSSFPCQVSEKGQDYISLTERHLQILWAERKLVNYLVTTQGECVEVISPGIWNKEAGPDFLKAHLRIGQREYRGDIEIHLHEGGWHQHGHDRDPRYNQVVLHLSFWRSLHPVLIHTENGQEPFGCYLDEQLSLSPDLLISLIDKEDDYPSKQFASSGQCAKLLFSSLSEQSIRNFFQSAAYWRLEKKLKNLEQWHSHPSMQFAAGIAMALGYRHNAKSFVELFFYLIFHRDLPYEELLAIALGCCGFLEEGRKDEWARSEYYQFLCRLWWGRKEQVIHQTHLQLSHIRPLHHPIRRLAYLTRLLQDACLEKLWPMILKKWERAMEELTPAWRQVEEELLQILPLYRDSYWDYHFTFECQKQPKCLPSVGKELTMHLLLNTTLPLLYATIKHSGNLQKWEKFQQFYASLRLSSNSKSRYLQQRFLGDREDKTLLSLAQMAQGAYQLHQDFCVHFEASCEGCPFVERYQAHMRP